MVPLFLYTLLRIYVSRYIKDNKRDGLARKSCHRFVNSSDRLSITIGKRLDVLSDPFEDSRETKFMTLHRAVNECVAFHPCDLDVKAVSTQEDVGGGEGDTPIAVEKAVIIAERFHQG